MLVEFAERELREAGWFSPESDYAGGIGESVLELVKTFAAQGHSGGSAPLTIALFKEVAMYRPLVPLKNPMKTGEYIDRSDISGGNPVFQSTRVSSVFSNDGGKTWYDINKRPPWYKRIFARWWLGGRVSYINFV